VNTPTCPACLAPNLTLVAKGELGCSYCGSSFRGIPLICPSCGWINTIEAERCPECAEPMTVIAQVISRQDQDGGPRWLRRVQSQAGEIKSAEERASQLRLQKLQEIDQKREEAIADQKEKQAKEDKLLYIIVLAIGLFIVLSIILIWLLLR
jgi:hypothetical protein